MITPQTDPTDFKPVQQIRPAAPRSVSESAQTFLDLPNPYEALSVVVPDLDDVEGWDRHIIERDAPVRDVFAPLMPGDGVVERHTEIFNGVPTFVLQPTETSQNSRALFLEIHGGALIQCGGDLAWMLAMPAAMERAGVTWVPDYRMPPRNPYPAALEDCVAAYRKALEVRRPNEIIISGGSAGGNLAAASLLKARAQGLPMPAGLVLISPELDLTESGDSFRTNLGIDTLGSLVTESRLYAAGHDLADPYLSPLFGDVSGFPPTFLMCGSREIFLSNTIRMHRKLLTAGVRAELHVLEAMPHGGFGGTSPEDKVANAEVRRFERDRLNAVQ